MNEEIINALSREVAKRRVMTALRVNLLRLAFVITVLAFWELASGRIIDPAFLSRPSLIFMRLVELFSGGSIWVHFRVTILELLVGYAIGAGAGLIIGFLLGRSKILSDIFEPFIMAFYSIPKVALAPLFIFWLGIGIWSKVAMVALMVFFLVFFNTYSGVKNIDEELVNIARVMGAKRGQVTRRVVLPASSPFIIMGFKTAVPFAVIGAVIGEFIASNKGLGFYILYSANTFDAAGLFSGILILLAMVFCVNQALTALQQRVLRWMPTAEAQIVS